MTSEQAAIRQAELANRQADYAARARWNRRLNVTGIACVLGIAVYIAITEAMRHGLI